MRHRLLLALIGATLLATACSSDGSDAEYGAAAEAFFAEWSNAWASADPYDIARFYDPDVDVELAQDYRALSMSASFRSTALGGRGRAWLVDWVAAQYEPMDRSLIAMFIGDESAVVLTTVDEIEVVLAVAMRLENGLIVSYTDLRWRDAHLSGGQPDVRMTWLDELVDAHQASSTPFSGGLVADVVTGERSGRAVFVGPDVAAYLVETEQDGCARQYLVVLRLDEQRNVVAEEWMPSLQGTRLCEPDEALAAGWWDDIELPLALGRQVSGVIPERDGTEIRVFNGTKELEGLLLWGLDRFEMAALVRPDVSSASFAPLPVCSANQGVVSDSGDGGPDLVLCTDAYRVCEPDRDTCTSFTAGSRLAILHELAHVWLLANLSPEQEGAFLAHRGLEHWSDSTVAWHERGAEQAAEIIAWGLMDEDIRLLRIGDPSCGEAAVAYELLTGSVSLRDCGQ